MNVYLDDTNQQVSMRIRQHLSGSIQKFQMWRKGDHEKEEEPFTPFILDPVYGGEATTFTDFMAPGKTLLPHMLPVAQRNSQEVLEGNGGKRVCPWLPRSGP